MFNPISPKLILKITIRDMVRKGSRKVLIAFDRIFFDPKHDIECPKCGSFNVGLIETMHHCLVCSSVIRPIEKEKPAVVIDFQTAKNKRKGMKS